MTVAPPSAATGDPVGRPMVPDDQDRAAVGGTHPRVPGVWRAGRARGIVEVKSFFRNKQSLFFTLLLPVLLLLVLGSIFSGDVTGTHVSFKQVFAAGIIAAGIMSVSFSGLAISMAIERDDGTVHRLAATPMPKSAYFVGKLVIVLITAVIETAALLLIGVAFVGLHLPATAGRWFTFFWVLALGAVAWTLLGIAYSRLSPNARSAAAVVTPPFIILQFISGVFFPFNELPKWMQTVAAFFPLKWMTQGLRYVFLPNSFAQVEVTHHWELGRVALILGIWCVAALVLASVSFRWRDGRDG